MSKKGAETARETDREIEASATGNGNVRIEHVVGIELQKARGILEGLRPDTLRNVDFEVIEEKLKYQLNGSPASSFVLAALGENFDAKREMRPTLLADSTITQARVPLTRWLEQQEAAADQQANGKNTTKPVGAGDQPTNGKNVTEHVAAVDPLSPQAHLPKIERLERDLLKAAPDREGEIRVDIASLKRALLGLPKKLQPYMVRPIDGGIEKLWKKYMGKVPRPEAKE